MGSCPDTNIDPKFVSNSSSRENLVFKWPSYWWNQIWSHSNDVQALTQISLFSPALKTIIARFISLFDLLLKNWTFSKYQALMAYCAGQKLSDFHMIKYVVYKLQTAAHVTYKREKFFSQDQSWVALSFSYNKCSNPKKWGFHAINVLHWQVRENGFSAVHQASSTVTINRVVLLFFCAKRMLRHPQRLGGCESISSQGGR